MKTRTINLFLILLSILLLSCSQNRNQNFTDSITVYEAWSDFHQNKNPDSCRSFIKAIDNFEPKKFNSYPILKSQTKNQIKICMETAQELLKILEESETATTSENKAIITEKIEQIDLCMLSYLRNQNFALEDTHSKFFTYFMWTLTTIITGLIILVYLNIREIKKKDQIIYNSEQFLKHSMEVQEAERRRISRELHDTVAQSMRYVSLLAEGLNEKNEAARIIQIQNENIENIRKLCYNLTPPSISADDMTGALEMLGQKIFCDDDKEFQFRVVIEDSVDFSAFTDEQLMNIYRIIQEAFQNIKKHAAATEVTLLFKNVKTMHHAEQTSRYTDSVSASLQIIITDDGCGMSEDLVNQINSGIFDNVEHLHFGVRNIYERVQLLGGTLTYRSEEECGTQITVVI